MLKLSWLLSPSKLAPVAGMVAATAELDCSAPSALWPFGLTDGPRSGLTSRTVDVGAAVDRLAAARFRSGADTSKPTASVTLALRPPVAAAGSEPATALGNPRTMDRIGIVNASRMADLPDRRNVMSVSLQDGQIHDGPRALRVQGRLSPPPPSGSLGLRHPPGGAARRRLGPESPGHARTIDGWLGGTAQLVPVGRRWHGCECVMERRLVGPRCDRQPDGDLVACRPGLMNGPPSVTITVYLASADLSRPFSPSGDAARVSSDRRFGGGD